MSEHGEKKTPGELESENVLEGTIEVTDMGAMGACQ